jgi:lysophospholipase L1-like esterase
MTAYDVSDIIILLGANDATEAWGTYNAGSFLTSYSAMLTALRTGLPSARIRCLGILDTTNATAAGNRTSVNTQIAAAVTAAADAGISYHSTDGWIVPASDTGDGLHPNDTGAAKVAAKVVRLLSNAIPVFTNHYRMQGIA